MSQDNDDFFLDEESMREIDEKEVLFFSQIPNATIARESKEQHVEGNGQKDCLTSENRGKKKTELSSRKNFILGLMETNMPSDTQQSLAATPTSHPSTEHLKRRSKLSDKREASAKKKLALGIMSQESTLLSRNENEPPNASREAYSNDRNRNSTHSTTPLDPPDTTPAPRSSPPVPEPKFKSPRAVYRKFPGPAGLIDATKSSSRAFGRFHDNLKNDPNNSENPEPYQRVQLCSQNTKRFFSHGAWRKMLDDVPSDLVDQYSIATVKRPGHPEKIPLLAVVVEELNFDTELPRVVLKDRSDTIKGIMHNKIFESYPYQIKRGVVLLLRDVGVYDLPASGYVLASSFAIIYPTSILAIYSDKARVVTTPEFREMFKIDCADQRDRDQESQNSTQDSFQCNLNIRVEAEVHHGRSQESMPASISFDDIQSSIRSNRPSSRLDIEEIESQQPSMNQRIIPKKARKLESQLLDEIISETPDDTFESQGIIESISQTSDDDSKAPKSQVIDDIISETSDNDTEASKTPVIEEIKSDTIGETIPLPSGFGSDLLDDSEDEMLSQLDIDSIASSYRSSGRI